MNAMKVAACRYAPSLRIAALLTAAADRFRRTERRAQERLDKGNRRSWAKPFVHLSKPGRRL